MAKSPVSLPFTTDGVEIAVKDNTALPANARGNISVGLDGSNNTQFLRITSLGALRVESTPKVSGTTALTNVALTTAASTVLSSNTSRLGATIYNDGGPSVFLCLGSGASSINFSVKMPPAGYYELPFSYTGIITAATETSTTTLRVTEFT